MEIFEKANYCSVERSGYRRRDFVKKGFYGTLAGFAGSGLLTSCKEEEEEEDVTPPEDLMREHGVLNRILLIYDTCITNLGKDNPFDPAALNSSAQIIRTFIEDYHEKMEEDYLFPRFEKSNKLTDLVQVLRTQHKAGRTLTDQIIQFSMKSPSTADESQRLIQLISAFNAMYRPHKAREDTVLFPAIRTIVSKKEFSSMGDDFEKKEHEMFGEDGFESMVEKVAGIEKQVGIYDLSQFTPQV
jgi:hemerythrin-like domain-containing protein